MNQKRNLTSAHSSLVRVLLLTGGLSGLGSISILSAGIAFAQTAPSFDSVPSAEDLLQQELQTTPLIEAPVEAAIEVEQPAASDPLTAIPETIVPEMEMAPPESVTPTPEFSPLEPPSALAEPAKPADALVSPNLSEEAIEAFGSDSGNSSYGNSSYIDPTPYSLGATQKPDVILSERSTGCQAVVSPGQDVPASLCPPVSTAEASYGDGLGNYDPSSLTVYNLQPGGSAVSARDFYNLTVRPPAKLSNGNVSLLFPISIPAAITSAFGWRIHPLTNGMRFHSGTDIGAPQGTPVLAAFDGKVEIADLIGGYGLTVVLQHAKGTEQTLYAHLSELFVKPGDNVKQGEVIGRVGSTGFSTGPHLHFEFRKLTPEGWVVMDAGSALEQALAQLVQSLQVAQTDAKLQLPVVFSHPGKALLRVTKSKTEHAPKVKSAEDTQARQSQPSQ